ncbi:acyl CoA binding protein-domain-containing protein [Parasitella parasitica]|nr:acyl CoA binding protein-domain-containing protein [Parasitella parasitica]
MPFANTTLSESLYVTQVRFCRALAVVRSLPTESGSGFQPSMADKLNFYGLYKQVLNGDCMLIKPSSRKVVAYAKWRAWDKVRGKSPIDAQIMYINALVKLLKEFLYMFPNSELTESLNESVNYLLEVNDDTTTTDGAEEGTV